MMQYDIYDKMINILNINLFYYESYYLNIPNYKYN